MNQQVRRIGPLAPEGRVTSLVEMREQREPRPFLGQRLWEAARGRGAAVTFLVVAAALVLGGVLLRYDRWKTAVSLRREALEQFLVYQDQLEDEYDVAYPLAAGAQQELTFERYKQSIDALNAAKKERQRTFARLAATAASLRAYQQKEAVELEKALRDSDGRASLAHGHIEGWIRDTYCMTADCENSEGRVHDPGFAQYPALMKIWEEVRTDRALDLRVRELIEAGL